MRIVMAAAFAAGLALAGCSEQTKDSASEAAKSAAADAASNTSEVLDQGAQAVGKAADKVDNDADTETTSSTNVNGGSTTTTTTTKTD